MEDFLTAVPTAKPVIPADSISAALAARAVSNLNLQALLDAVASSQATGGQFTALQRYTEEIAHLTCVARKAAALFREKLERCEKVRDLVFSSPKFCEAIFLYLNRRDVLTAVQRTCKLWKKTLRRCHKVQQALFFEPIAPALKDYVVEDERGLRLTEESYSLYSSPIVKTRIVDEGYWIDQHHHKFRARIIANPTYHMYEWQDWQSGYYLRREEYDNSIIGRREASWRKQLLCQPPVPYLNDFHYNMWALPASD